MHSISRSAITMALGLAVATPMMAQAPAAATPAALPPVGTSIVFVNTQAILPIAPGADSAQIRFQEVLNGYAAELQALSTSYDSLLTAYQQQEALLDATGRQLKQQEIRDRQQAAQQRQADLETQSNRDRDALLAPIIQRITDTIEEIRMEREYAIVFDFAESGIVAADPALDITAAVLERLGVDPSLATASSGN